MYAKHPAFLAPPDVNVTIWRYMSLAKLVSLLTSQSLFFARADRLGDPFEGSVPVGTRLVRDSIMAQAPKTEPGWIERVGEAMPRCTAINCWHMNDHESAAMWRLYAPSGEGVAIRSTFQKLANSFHLCSDTVYLGMVRYLDYDRQIDVDIALNLLAPFLRKRISFRHEQELRCVISKTPHDSSVPGGIDLEAMPIEDGVLAPVDLSELLAEVRISPTAPPWYKEAVEAVTDRFEIGCPVAQSSLDKTPVW